MQCFGYQIKYVIFVNEKWFSSLCSLHWEYVCIEHDGVHLSLVKEGILQLGFFHLKKKIVYILVWIS